MAVPPSLRERVGEPPVCDCHHFAEGQRVSDGLAGVEVAARWRLGQRGDGRRDGIDLRSALGQAREREIGGVACTISDARRVEIDGSGGEGRGVLPGADGVAEGERIGAGATVVGGGAAVIEGERRRAACYRDRLAQSEGQTDGLSGIEVAARG